MRRARRRIPAQPSPDPARRDRRVIPFWLHQGLEYLLAAVLVGTAFHVTGPSRWTMLAGAGLLVLLAAATDGPLGAWRLLGPRSHRGADWVVVAALAVSPVVPGRGAVSILVLEATAVLLARLVGFTRYRAPETPAPGRPAPGRPASARPAADQPGPATPETPQARPSVAAAAPSPDAGTTGPSADADVTGPSADADVTAQHGDTGPAPANPQVELAVRRHARRAGLAVGILQRRARDARRQP